MRLQAFSLSEREVHLETLAGPPAAASSSLLAIDLRLAQNAQAQARLPISGCSLRSRMVLTSSAVGANRRQDIAFDLEYRQV